MSGGGGIGGGGSSMGGGSSGSTPTVEPTASKPTKPRSARAGGMSLKGRKPIFGRFKWSFLGKKSGIDSFVDKLANEGVSVSSTAVKKEQAKTQIPAALVRWWILSKNKTFFRRNQSTSEWKKRSSLRQTEMAVWMRWFCREWCSSESQVCIIRPKGL